MKLLKKNKKKELVLLSKRSTYDFTNYSLQAADQSAGFVENFSNLA